MKSLQKIFEKISPSFHEGGKFKALKPAYEAMENFFFASSKRTVVGPYVRDPLDVKRFMSMVIIAIVPCFLGALYFYGLRIIAMLIVSYAVGGAVEIVFAIVRKEQINEGFLVTGMLFPLILPPTLPLWMVGLGVGFGVFVGKELFGGTGRNVFNPALVGRCFLAIAYPAAMSGNWVVAGEGVLGRLNQYVSSASIDAMSAATPLVLAKQGNLVELSRMFLGNILGSTGETSGLLIVLGGVFLLFTRVANWRTVVSILASAGVLAGILHHFGPEQFGPALWHLCAGGMLFGAFFMATDPVTSPATNIGKWMYGIIIGVITILIRNFTGYVEGVMFAILLGNIFAPILDEIVVRIQLRRLRSEG